MKTRYLLFIGLFLANFSFLNAQTWTTAELSAGRWHTTSIANGDKLVVAGGAIGSNLNPGVSKVVDIYDATTKTWTTAQLGVAREGMVGVAVGDKIIFGCGWTLTGRSNIFDIYDIKTGIWTSQTHGQKRGYMGGAAVGKKAYFIGGDIQTGFSKDVDIYDSESNSWSLGTPITFDISSGSVVAFGTKIMIKGNGKIGIYDTETGVWSNSNEAKPAYALMPVLTETEIWFIGGFDATTNEAINSIQIYNIANQTWSEKELSVARGAGMAGYLGGRIVIAGGQTIADFIPNTAIDWVEIYDTKTGIWEQEIVLLSEPHAYFSPVRTAPIIGAEMFFSGGDPSGDGSVTTRVEIYTDTLLATSSSAFLSHLPETSLEVGPQPFHDFLDLKSYFSNDLDGKLQIFGPDGRLVLEQKIEKGQLEKTQIDASNWSSGNYFLGVISKKGSLSKKLIKLE